MSALALPPEAEVLLAQQAHLDAQAALAGELDHRIVDLHECSWFGTAQVTNRGYFALVTPEGPLAELVGDFISVRNWRTGRAVRAYVVGGLADMPTPLALARRAFFDIEVLSASSVTVEIEVLR